MYTLIKPVQIAPIDTDISWILDAPKPLELPHTSGTSEKITSQEPSAFMITYTGDNEGTSSNCGNRPRSAHESPNMTRKRPKSFQPSEPQKRAKQEPYVKQENDDELIRNFYKTDPDDVTLDNDAVFRSRDFCWCGYFQFILFVILKLSLRKGPLVRNFKNLAKNKILFQLFRLIGILVEKWIILNGPLIAILGKHGAY